MWARIVRSTGATATSRSGWLRNTSVDTSEGYREWYSCGSCSHGSRSCRLRARSRRVHRSHVIATMAAAGQTADEHAQAQQAALLRKILSCRQHDPSRELQFAAVLSGSVCSSVDSWQQHAARLNLHLSFKTFVYFFFLNDSKYLVLSVEGRRVIGHSKFSRFLD